MTSAHAIVDAAMIVLGSIFVSLVVLWIVRRLVSHQQLTPHNEVSGFVYAAIGVLYAVLAAFVVITIWEDYRDAENAAVQEANAVADLYRLAGGLPDPTRGTIRQAALAYADVVVNEEWPSMAEGNGAIPQATTTIDQMWRALSEAQVTDPTQVAILQESLARMEELSNLRRQRIVESDSGLLSIMWGVLIGGAALTVLFPCVFGVENGVLHALIIATLAATLGLLILLTYDLNQPYRGDVRVAPEALLSVIEQFSAPPGTSRLQAMTALP